jgi:ribosomal protein S12 methylthiotransferase accessory factor
VPSDLHRLVSADVGVINRVDESVAPYDHPRLSSFFAQSSDTVPLFGNRLTGSSGAMAADRASARAAATGEAVERYSVCHAPESRLRRATRTDLGDAVSVVAPDWRAEPSESPLSWLRGTRLGTGPGDSEPAWLPAHRVFLSGVDSEAGVATGTSTGLACHTEPWRALRSSLLEVIERDAVMVTWLSRSTPRAIWTDLRWRTNGIDIRFDLAVERYRLYLLESPVRIPVVFAVATGNRNQPTVAVGAAAHLDLVLACRKALIEAQQTFGWARHMLAQQRRIPTLDEIEELDDHVAYYLDPARLRAFDFLDARSRRPPISVDLREPLRTDQPERDVYDVVRQARCAGLDCFCADVTAPEVREAGAWVVRALIPALYPLTVADQHRSDHPRLAHCDSLNPDPHPFP